MTRLWIVIIALFTFLAVAVAPSYAAKIHKGTVIEATTAGPYTYMQIEEGKEKFWIAATPNKFKKGTKVSFAEQLWMYKFKSKSMDRVFDKILFVAKVYLGDDALKAPTRERPTTAAKSMAPLKQKKAYGTFTVEELFTKKAELKGKSVKVKGKVVKVLDGIMGMTWVHIQDGTGATGSNDIIFTSKRDTAVVGSTVTAQGTLIIDKDFGSGYFYAVIMEDSTFTK
jgi:hypothetical protein